MGAKSGQTRKSAGVKRLGLIVFGLLFAGLFVGFAIAQGIGQPSVPSGDVAIVKGVPSDISAISEAELKRGILQQASQGGLKKAPKPGGKKYEELRAAAQNELLDAIWIRGEAEELDTSVTDKQVEAKLAEIKKENFPTESAYQEFLKTSHFTQEDVDSRIEQLLLSTQIQEVVSSQAPPASSSEIADYYEAEKAAQFTTKPTRDVRIVLNEDKSKVEEAKEALEKDDSAASWKTVAAKYSADPTTKSKSGLQVGLSEELIPAGPLKAAIFESATGELVGPVEFQKKFILIEVVKVNPEKVQTLDEVRSQISSTLTQQVQQEFFSEFVTEYQSKWQSRTFCASGFVTERCANYVGSGHPASAPPACYEASPKGGSPPECPAPVTQTSPALPGSVTVVKPKGEPFPQRPYPESAGKSTEAGATLPEEAPGTAPSGE